MKKTYIIPVSTLCAIAPEGMIATSGPTKIGYDESKSGSSNLSNEQDGWYSGPWAKSGQDAN